MAPDEFQKAWQAHLSQARVTVDADLLRKEVQLEQQNFQTMIFSRDFGEVGLALLMIPFWIVMGVMMALPWTWYLTVPVLIWSAGFMLVYRMRHRQPPGQPDDSLVVCVQRSLTEQEDQIWLLRNVFWWYLLPPSLSLLAFFAQVSWQSRTAGWLFALSSFVGLSFFVLVIYGFIFWLNRRAIRVQLEPKREALSALLASLTDESANGAGAENVTVSVASLAETKAAKPISFPRTRLAIGLIGFFVILGAVFAFMKADRSGRPVRATVSSDDPRVHRGDPTDHSLAGVLSRQREQNKLVGLAAMVMVDGKVVESAVDGERKIRSGVPLEIGDRWHVGGITCSITATMIGSLVESGQLRWADTVGQIFPEAAVHEHWKSVTLKQLLTNTAGAPLSFPPEVRKKRPALGPECLQARREAVLEMISEEPVTASSHSGISSVGPTIAGAMAEKVTGDAWSDLVREIVFQPLKLAGAGFGPPKSSPDLLEQPRGHRMLPGKSERKYGVNDMADNTPIVGPALTVHMTLHDLCTYATEHLRGYFREGRLLSAETYRVLHTPERNQYACGWVRRKPDSQIPYTVYWHNGSNTLWYALVMFIPEKNMVVAVTSNDGDFSKAETAAWEIVKAKLAGVDIVAERPDGESIDYPKKSPFVAVRWQGLQPEVKLGEEWFLLVSLDQRSASEIVDFSRRTHGDRWRKRFEEDLVELLARMGQPPKNKVTLVVESLTTGEKLVREGVPMTEDNRKAIRDAATGERLNTGSTQ